MKFLSEFSAGERTGLTERVKEQSGVNFDRCYQCRTCTLSCPVLFAMEYPPDRIVRMIQLGAGSEVLRSKAIWQCVSCEACVTRCPQEIDIPRLMDSLRHIAIQEGISAGDNPVLVFHQVFLNGIRRWGRQYELGIMAMFKLKTRDFFSDLGLGVTMLRKKKLSLLPRRNGNREVEAIFQKIK